MLRRRLPAIACAAGAVLALAACTSPTTGPTPSAAPASSLAPSPSAVASASTTPSASASPAPSTSTSAAEQRYLGFVQQFNQNLATIPAGTLVALGRQVCTGFQQGQDAGTVSQGLGDSTLAPNLQAEDAAVIIGAAVATICPQYRKQLEGSAG